MKFQAVLINTVLGVIGSLMIWAMTEMRTDFKNLIESVNHLTTEMAVLADQVGTERSSVLDHEMRLRKLENGHLR